MVKYMQNFEEMKVELLKKIPEFVLRVQPIYALLGWKWSNGEVPSVDEIDEMARTLIISLGQKCSGASSGGLTARIMRDTDCGDSLRIEMSIWEQVYPTFAKKLNED
jgi:hypothetical protein